MSVIAMATNENHVAPGDGCPRCGERDADRLVWLDDDHFLPYDRVECQSCGKIYDPLAEAKRRAEEGGSNET